MQNRAKNRKYHYIYRITRFDGKYYIGRHSTDNLEDGYFGSGTYLARSKRKHGLDKHVMEILEFLPDRPSLVAREKELVCKELIEDALCMNIAIGGDGGWDHFNSSEGFKNHQLKCAAFGRAAFAAKLKSDAAFAEKISKTRSKVWSGRKHSLETRAKMSLSQKGKIQPPHTEETKSKMSRDRKGKGVGNANSQFGTCWINDGEKAFKISKSELSIFLNKGFFKGRKLCVQDQDFRL